VTQETAQDTERILDGLGRLAVLETRDSERFDLFTGNALEIRATKDRKQVMMDDLAMVDPCGVLPRLLNPL